MRRLEATLRGLSPQARMRRDAQRVERARGGLLRVGRDASRDAHRVLADLGRSMTLAAARLPESASQRMRRLETQLRALSPLSVLERGFSITRSEDGTVVRSARQVRPGDGLRTRLAEGRLFSKVTKSERGEKDDKVEEPEGR
jgi:exodeoxyribonuclease VII large subunit